MSGRKRQIVDWLHTQRDWIQDAAERILKLGQLDDDQVNELVERLKTSEGNQVTPNRTFAGLTATAAANSDLRLESIGNVCGIDNLSPRSPLEFGVGNLTVIYGHNGAGKSSYARILKKVSGKPRSTDLKANVFQNAPPSQQCDISYTQSAATPTTATWIAKSTPIDALEPIDIFEGEAASFYLSRESEVSYTPPDVALFEEVVRTCNRIKAQLESEQDRLVSKLPEIPSLYAGTLAGKGYRFLAPTMTEKALDALLVWADEENSRIEQLEERLKTADPNKLAKAKRNRKARLSAIADMLEQCSNSLSNDACAQIKAKRQFALDLRRQATESAKANAESGQLDGIGTDTWNAMWQAAREYSASHAYPEQSFPVTGGDARCVLCHQLLDANAKQRLHEFEAFVQGKLESEAKAAETVAQQALQNLPKIPTDDEIRAQLEAGMLTEDRWNSSLCEFWQASQKTIDRIKSGATEDEQFGITEPTDLITEVRELAAALEQEAVQHDLDAKVFDRNKSTQDKLDLEANRWTSQQESAIREEVQRLRASKQFDDWKKLTNTTGISRQAGQISQKAMTDEYVRRFNSELVQLGAKRIKIELKRTRVDKDVPKHRILLKGLSANQMLPDSVLSDGERRIVALAVFLADVTGKPYTAPFVFDDPLSSLDIDFEWDVARRLAELAKDRQVIVLTHRLSLYGAMEDAAKKVGDAWKGKHLTQICIESFGGTAGHPVDQEAWNANTKQANNILLSRLNDAKKHWDKGDSQQYRIAAQTICSEFRKLVERTVEHDLLCDVVKRHRRSVHTDNKIKLLPTISVEDCRFIDGLMTKYSCYEHSQSSETPVFTPDEPELRQDLESLRDWRNDFASRVVEESV